MKTRISLFVISFLIGLYLWFPYSTVYRGVLDRAVSKLPLKVEYKLNHATLTEVSLSKLKINYQGTGLSEDGIRLRVNPLGFILGRDLVAIKKRGLFVRIGYSSPLYLIDAVFKDYRDPNLKDAIINGRVSVAVDKKTGLLKEGSVDINAGGLGLKASGIKMGFKKVTLKCSISDGTVEIKRLKTLGDVNAQITGRLKQDVKDFLNSRLNLDIRYQIGGQSLSTTYKARLAKLLYMYK